MSLCETCRKNEAIGVCCIPGMPVSVGYCESCLNANAHPWEYMVANAFCCGGRANMNEWSRMMIEDTCKYFGRTLEEFDKAIEELKEKEDREYEATLRK